MGFFYGFHLKKALTFSFGTMQAAGDKADDAPFGWVEGQAIGTESNRYRRVILPEAMKAAYPAFKTNPVLALGHDISGHPMGGLPIGTVLWLKWDAEGNTLFRARFADTPEAQKVRGLYQSKDMRAFSIHFWPTGYREPTKEEMKRWPGVEQVITDLDLIEISCAVVGVDATALVTASQSITRPRTLKESAMEYKLSDDSTKHLASLKASFGHGVEAMNGIATSMEEMSEHSGDDASTDPKELVKKMGAHLALCKSAVKSMLSHHANLSLAIGEGEEPEEDDGDGEDDDSEETEQALTAALDKVKLLA